MLIINNVNVLNCKRKNPSANNRDNNNRKKKNIKRLHVSDKYEEEKSEIAIHTLANKYYYNIELLYNIEHFRMFWLLLSKACAMHLNYNS